jgi:hypothetical protein
MDFFKKINSELNVCSDSEVQACIKQKFFLCLDQACLIKLVRLNSFCLLKPLELITLLELILEEDWKEIFALDFGDFISPLKHVQWCRQTKGKGEAYVSQSDSQQNKPARGQQNTSKRSKPTESNPVPSHNSKVCEFLQSNVHNHYFLIVLNVFANRVSTHISHGVSEDDQPLQRHRYHFEVPESLHTLWYPNGVKIVPAEIR